MIIWFIKIFLYSSVYFCHLFLIYCASLGPYHFCHYCACLCLKCSLGISNFLVEISSLSHSIVFLYFFALILKAFLFLLATPWNSAFKCVYLFFPHLLFASLLCTAIYKASSDNHFAFLHFFFLQMVLVHTSYTTLQTSVRSSSGTVFTRTNLLNLFITSTV